MSMAQDTSVGSTSSNSSNNNIERRRAEIMQGPLRKGPWTAEEDKILREYVNKHGEGNWHVVERASGLRRCGKSCRLRWANQLKPNLKKGPMSVEEEAIIVNLHHKLGNKWAKIASQLPGRTDNEIKNFWNTRYKKCQRDNLRVYEVFSWEQKTPNHQQQSTTYNPLLFSPPPPSTMPVLQHPGNPTRTSIYDVFPSRNTNSLHELPNSSSFISNVTGSLNGLNARPYGKEIINHHSPSLFNMPYNYPFQYNGQYGEASGTTRRFPSVQTFVPIDDGFTAPRDGNTGLLEDVVRGYLNNMQHGNEDIRIQENDAVPEQSFTSFLDGVLVEPNYGDEPNPAHSSTRTNVMTNTSAPMDPSPVYDDELSHLLVNFASVAPTSDWFDRGETVEENCNQNPVED